jgi:hypothetical protein
VDILFGALLVLIIVGVLVAILGVTIAVLYGRRWRRKVREEGIQGYIGPDGYWHATRPPDNRPPPPPFR